MLRNITLSLARNSFAPNHSTALFSGKDIHKSSALFLLFCILTIPQNVKKSIRNRKHLISGIRHLYTAEALGLDGYKTGKERANLLFTSPQMKDNFRKRMTEFLKPENTNLVFTDDLKQMLNLAENTPEDISLLTHMIEK